jgi:hypothetical protein
MRGRLPEKESHDIHLKPLAAILPLLFIVEASAAERLRPSTRSSSLPRGRP